MKFNFARIFFTILSVLFVVVCSILDGISTVLNATGACITKYLPMVTGTFDSLKLRMNNVRTKHLINKA